MFEIAAMLRSAVYYGGADVAAAAARAVATILSTVEATVDEKFEYVDGNSYDF